MVIKKFIFLFFQLICSIALLVFYINLSSIDDALSNKISDVLNILQKENITNSDISNSIKFKDNLVLHHLTECYTDVNCKWFTFEVFRKNGKNYIVIPIDNEIWIKNADNAVSNDLCSNITIGFYAKHTYHFIINNTNVFVSHNGTNFTIYKLDNENNYVNHIVLLKNFSNNIMKDIDDIKNDVGVNKSFFKSIKLGLFHYNKRFILTLLKLPNDGETKLRFILAKEDVIFKEDFYLNRNNQSTHSELQILPFTFDHNSKGNIIFIMNYLHDHEQFIIIGYNTELMLFKIENKMNNSKIKEESDFILEYVNVIQYQNIKYCYYLPFENYKGRKNNFLLCFNNDDLIDIDASSFSIIRIYKHVFDFVRNDREIRDLIFIKNYIVAYENIRPIYYSTESNRGKKVMIKKINLDLNSDNSAQNLDINRIGRIICIKTLTYDNRFDFFVLEDLHIPGLNVTYNVLGNLTNKEDYFKSKILKYSLSTCNKDEI